MSRGFGKYRRGASHHNFHFDTLFKENSNRPSAARSAASVGKWGITSFTSIRTINGRAENDSNKDNQAPKPKKFFKSRDRSQESNSPKYQPYNKETSFGGVATAKRARTSSESKTNEKSTKSSSSSSSSSPKKFFSSKNSQQQQEKVVTLNSQPTNKRRKSSDKISDSNNAAAESSSSIIKPPIVLRICRGKSQLINDDDDDDDAFDTALTPNSSSTSTSPRALRETSNAQQQQQQQTSPRPSNCRITRSARRSMQMDANSSSPAAADTAAEAVFTTTTASADDNPLSPQYVPADKFEAERRAMYASLLKPDSPSSSSSSSDDNNKKTDASDAKSDQSRVLLLEENEAAKSVEDAMAELYNESHHNKINSEVDEEKMDIDTVEAHKSPDIESIENIAKEIENTKESIIKPNNNNKMKIEEETIIMNNSTVVNEKKTIEEDWDSDSSVKNAPIELKPSSTEEVQEEIVNSNIQNKRPPDQHQEEIFEKLLEKPPEPPPPPPAVVKLVISKKKGSIFKSRALVDDDSKKRRARYVHKWQEREGGETPARPPVESNPELENEFEFNESLIKITDEEKECNKITCSKTDKSYYMVVKNVKKAHQIQEIGEFQEFNDDVEYILDALQHNNPISTRCLSAITLASKCMAPAFRMHVRAHGTVAKFFKALHDATKDQSLGLCTATVMFVLSQDRLNMDLDRDCLELMLNLLESDVSYQQALDVCGLSSTQLEKNKQKVRELCAEIQSQGHAMHLNLENITTGQLAMETLLSLTSKRAGEWFKEELRELGGLEHIMKTIHECCRQVSDYVVSWTDALLDKLKKVDRCLRVLENVTQNNEENQTYILKHNNGFILDTLVNLYKLCDGEIPLYPVTDISDKSSTGAIIREALLVTLKVLINLTHHYRQQSIGSQLIGAKCGIVETSLHLLLQVPNYIPDQKKFELGVLVLMLLINLIQDQDTNKKLLMDAKAPSKLESIYSREESAVEALIVQFYEWEQCARIAENKTNAILDGEKDDEPSSAAATTRENQPQNNKTNEEFIEETVAKLLQKAGTHMEFTFLASYIVMLIGFLIMDNETYQINIRQYLKGDNFIAMVELLKKFFNFMSLTTSTEASSVCAIKATQKVIKFLETCDQSASENNSLINKNDKKKDNEPVDLALSYL